MKTILVPTDYSDVAYNAMQYAAELAKTKNARLILFHAYHIRTLLSSLTLVNGGFEEENLHKLEELERDLRKKYGKQIPIELAVRKGFAIAEILNIIKEEKVDLVVMGLAGSSLLSETLIGSTTTTVLEKTKVPVLVIPKGAIFKKPEKVVVSYDKNAPMQEIIMQNIKDFVKSFNAKILLFNMTKTGETATYENANSKTVIENSLKGAEHDYHSHYGENLVDEINNFIDAENADMLIMVPHSHNSLADIFHISNTEKMAFHTHIPLLSFHD